MKRAQVDASDATSTASGSSDMQAGHEDESGSEIDEFAFDMVPRPSQGRGEEDAVDDLPLLPALYVCVFSILPVIAGIHS